MVNNSVITRPLTVLPSAMTRDELYRNPKVRGAFASHRHDARRRGIRFHLTYQQWFDIWYTSGHLHERGYRKGQFVMCRYGDNGPYSVGNVRIATVSQNCMEAHARLTWEQVHEARRLFAAGASRRQIAKKFGIGQTTASSLVRGLTYAQDGIVVVPRRSRPVRPLREVIADDIARVGKWDLASALGVSVWTIDRWRKQGRFPKPIRLTDRSPLMWRIRDIDAFLLKRQHARIPPEPLRGIVKAQAREGDCDDR